MPAALVLTGSLVLGRLPDQLLKQLPRAAAAPRSRSTPFYNVLIQGVKFGEELLNVDLAAMERGYGTIVDSGTTFSYLPTQAHAAFVGAFADAASDLGYSLQWDELGTHCFASCAPPLLQTSPTPSTPNRLASLLALAGRPEHLDDSQDALVLACLMQW